MARRPVTQPSGFTFHYTDLDANVFPPKSGCITDSMAWEDLDGDGCIDFVCIGTVSGDYEDADHEVVAIHVPSGNRMWTALRGEASKKLSMIDGIVVVSTNAAQRLRGLDARTGQELWQAVLPDELKEDGFDGEDTAPSIAPLGGPWAGIECIDDTSHVIDVRTGRFFRSLEGELRPYTWNLPGLVAFKIMDDDGDDVIEIWDLAQGRSVCRMSDSGVRTLHGSGYYGFIHDGETPGGDYGTMLRMFATPGNQPAGVVQLQTADGSSPGYGSATWGHSAGFLLPGRAVFGDPWADRDSAWSAALGQATSMVAPWQPPKGGYVLRALAWCAPSLVGVWQKAKGTEHMVACGYDPTTLQTRWVVDELGGSLHHENPLHVTSHAVLVPRANDGEFGPSNPSCLVHLDPATGQKLQEYPVEATDCVGVARHFLVGCPDYFSGGVPLAYDTWNRVRVL